MSHEARAAEAKRKALARALSVATAQRVSRPKAAMKRAFLRDRQSLFCVILSTATACVPETAGYDDVRRSTAARLGKDVRWQAVDAGGATEKRTRELLARPLDAEAAVQIALLNNAGLQADFEELGVARAELAGAVKLPNPTADVS